MNVKDPRVAMTSDAQDRGNDVTRNLAAFWLLGLINNSGGC